VRTRRLQLGPHLRVIGEAPDGVQLEGVTRLYPGQVVELAIAPAHSESAPARTAFVMSWSVVGLGKDGPTYRGQCRWQ
jgi:hypothetical protein